MPAAGSRDAQLYSIKERAAAQLMSVPGVSGVGLGGRRRDGRPTGELVLKVYVDRKRPLSELTPGETLPERFEGLGIDVGELGPIVPHTDTVDIGEAGTTVWSALDVSVAHEDSAKYRPLSGGVRILPAVDGGLFGTLGCFLEHQTDPTKVYGLTCHHVIAPNVNVHAVVGSTRVGQPDADDSLFRCLSNLIGTFAGGSENTIRDAALIQLDVGTKWLAEIVDIGVPSGTHTITPDEAATGNYEVFKRGALTTLTGGVVDSVDVLGTANGVTRHNNIVIFPNFNGVTTGAGFFGGEGDSGSAVLNKDYEVVGLHIGGSPANSPIHKAFALPIEAIIAEFAKPGNENLPLKLAVRDETGEVNVVQGARSAVQVELPARAAGMPPYPQLLAKLAADLDRSPAGRRLLALWSDHQAELSALVNGQRRLAVAWHRGGGPALLQLLIRGAADPELSMPRTVNGVPPNQRLARLHATFRAAASPELGRALDRAYADLPDLAGLTYPQILSALGAV
jgi:hypothetical protein